MKNLVTIISTTLFSAIMMSSCCNCDKNEQGQCPNKEGENIEAGCPDKPFCDKKGPDGRKHGGPHRGECRGEFPGGFPGMDEKMEKWMKFDSLSVDEQKELIKERKAQIDEMEAKKAELEQKWADFDNLTIEEQKQLIDMKSCPMFGFRKGCHKGPHPGAGMHGEKRGPKHHGPRPDKKDNNE